MNSRVILTDISVTHFEIVHQSAYTKTPLKIKYITLRKKKNYNHGIYVLVDDDWQTIQRVGISSTTVKIT